MGTVLWKRHEVTFLPVQTKPPAPGQEEKDSRQPHRQPHRETASKRKRAEIHPASKEGQRSRRGSPKIPQRPVYQLPSMQCDVEIATCQVPPLYAQRLIGRDNAPESRNSMNPGGSRSLPFALWEWDGPQHLRLLFTVTAKTAKSRDRPKSLLTCSLSSVPDTIPAEASTSIQDHQLRRPSGNNPNTSAYPSCPLGTPSSSSAAPISPAKRDRGEPKSKK